MEYKTIKYEIEDQIAWITFNRPTMMNSMNKALYRELADAMHESEKNDYVKVIVLTGEGNAFSAGADILDFGVAKRSVYDSYDYTKATLDALDAVEFCDKPVIAAVNGLAVGGGLEFTLLCDVVIASRDAMLGLPEGKLGIIPGTAVSKIQKVLPKHIAMEIMLTGKVFSAREGAKMGLVNDVVAPDKLKEAVMKMANEMKKVAPLSHKYIKKIWRAAPQDYDYWYTVMPQLFVTEDSEEGQKAFLEKRAAVWTGKFKIKK